MDFGDGFHIDDACFEKDKFFEAKTNIKAVGLDISLEELLQMYDIK